MKNIKILVGDKDFQIKIMGKTSSMFTSLKRLKKQINDKICKTIDLEKHHQTCIQYKIMALLIKYTNYNLQIHLLNTTQKKHSFVFKLERAFGKIFFIIS